MLKERQIEILDFIKRFIAENGYSPTIREISIGTNTKSVSTVQENLKKLINNGLITIDKNKSRTIELLIENEYMTGQVITIDGRLDNLISKINCVLRCYSKSKNASTCKKHASAFSLRFPCITCFFCEL